MGAGVPETVARFTADDIWGALDDDERYEASDQGLYMALALDTGSRIGPERVDGSAKGSVALVTGATVPGFIRCGCTRFVGNAHDTPRS
jgi:hypothetical protein